MKRVQSLSLFLLMSAPALMALNPVQITEIDQLLKSNPQGWYQQSLEKSLDQVKKALPQASGDEAAKLNQLADALDTRLQTPMTPPPPPPPPAIMGRRAPRAQDLPEVQETPAQRGPKIVAPKDPRQSPNLAAEAAGTKLKPSRPTTPVSNIAAIQENLTRLEDELTDPKTNKFRALQLKNTEIPKAKEALDKAKKTS